MKSVVVYAQSMLTLLVRMTGVEPVIPRAADFKSAAYANSATSAYNWRLGVYHDTAEAERVMLHKGGVVSLSTLHT